MKGGTFHDSFLSFGFSENVDFFESRINSEFRANIESPALRRSMHEPRGHCLCEHDEHFSLFIHPQTSRTLHAGTGSENIFFCREFGNVLIHLSLLSAEKPKELPKKWVFIGVERSDEASVLGNRSPD
jgi:hypothetical protein